MTGAVVWVVGVDPSGAERVREPLAHGDDPSDVFARSGFSFLGPTAIEGQADPHEVVLRYDVTALDGPAPAVDPAATPRDAGLDLRPGEEPFVLQRLAVYAFVHSDRGLLLAQNSARTNAPGTWGLPGGGLDPGELPEAALHREVWEESGQQIRVDEVATVVTRHWVGRAPYGRLEDFHAVRLVYRATCPDPGEPVVHDVDGTTAASAWFPPSAVEQLPLAASFRDVLSHLGAGDLG